MKHRSDFILREIGDKRILIPLGKEMSRLNGIITFNETGAFLWEQLADECSIEKLNRVIVERFNVKPEVAEFDVKSFLNSISNLELLEK